VWTSGWTARAIETGATLSSDRPRMLRNDVMATNAVANIATVAAPAIAGLNQGDESPRSVHDRRRAFSPLERPCAALIPPNFDRSSPNGNRANETYSAMAGAASRRSTRTCYMTASSRSKPFMRNLSFDNAPTVYNAQLPELEQHGSSASGAIHAEYLFTDDAIVDEASVSANAR